MDPVSAPHFDSVKEKNYSNTYYNNKEDFIQGCCSRRESWGSTHNTIDSWKFIDNKQSKGINRWKITKRRHQG